MSLFNLRTITIFVPVANAKYAAEQLSRTYGGCTILPGECMGVWMDDDFKRVEDTLRRLQVSMPAAYLEVEGNDFHVNRRLADLAYSIGEECLYVTCGDAAAIIDATQPED